MKDLHSIDILFGLWQNSSTHPSGFIGFTVVTQSFRAGHYFESCEQVGSWRIAKEQLLGSEIREYARGPAGCFDPLLSAFPGAFQDGKYLVGPPTDPDWLSDPNYGNLTPAEVEKLVDRHGTFVTVEYLRLWLQNLTR